MTALEFLLLGLAAGAVYGLLGAGLVLEYRGSGVVNFAHGAMAMYIAYVFLDLRTYGLLELPLPPFLPDHINLGSPLGMVSSLIISLVYAMFLGLFVYFAIFRLLRHASSLGRVVASVGLMLTLESLVALQFGTSAQSTPPLLPTTSLRLGATLVVPWDGVDLLGIVLIVAALLWGIYRFTYFGLATRAVAETEKGALLLGLAPTRIAAANWVIATVLAGGSGILLIQITALAPDTYTLLIVPALAVAFIGRFTSFWGTVAAGLFLGIAQSEVTPLMGTWTWLPQGSQDAVPLLMMLVAIAIYGRVLPTRGMLLEIRLPQVPAPRNLVRTAIGGAAVLIIALFLLQGDVRLGLIVSIITALICLSFTVLTGFAGQISLSQMSFAGIGGFVASHLAVSAGIGFPIDVLLGAIAATILGVIVGIPAQRARGVSLAVITLVVASTMDAMVFGQNGINGGFNGAQFPALKLFGLNLDIRSSNVHTYPRVWFGIVAVVFLVLVALAVANLRRTATGRRMLAVRGNEQASAALGINVAGMKIYAFALSSFIAGLGGALLGYQQGTLGAASFTTFVSVGFLAIAFIGGVGRVSGALLAGLFLAAGGLVPTLLNNAINFGSYLDLVSGLGVVILALQHPDGMASAFPPRQLVRLLQKGRGGLGGGPTALRGNDAPSTMVDGDEPKTLDAVGGAK